MRMEVHVHGSLYLLKGVARAQVEAALRPWLDYLDIEHLEEARSLEPEEPGIVLDDRNRVLEICWTGEIGRSFQRCLEDSMNALGPLTEQAAEVEVSFYHETGEDEMRLIFVGPTPEAIHEAQRQRMVEDVSALLARHFDRDAVTEVVALVNELFRREWNSKAVQEPSSLETPPSRGRKHLH